MRFPDCESISIRSSCVQGSDRQETSSRTERLRINQSWRLHTGNTYTPLFEKNKHSVQQIDIYLGFTSAYTVMGIL